MFTAVYIYKLLFWIGETLIWKLGSLAWWMCKTLWFWGRRVERKGQIRKVGRLSLHDTSTKPQNSICTKPLDQERNPEVSGHSWRRIRCFRNFLMRCMSEIEEAGEEREESLPKWEGWGVEPQNQFYISAPNVISWLIRPIGTLSKNESDLYWCSLTLISIMKANYINE